MAEASMIATLRAISPAMADRLSHERIAFLKAAAGMQAELDLVTNTLRALVDTARNSDGTLCRSVRVTELHAAAKLLEKIDATDQS